MDSFEGLNAQVLGISVDHVPGLQSWAESLGGIHYPLLSDFWPHGSVANQYGVLRTADGFSERAIFVLDAQGVIRYIDIHAIDDRPDNEEVRKALRRIEEAAVAETTAAAEATAVAEAAAIEAENVGADAASGVYFEELEGDAAAGADIVVYCALWCKDCRKVRNWLSEHGLEFVEVDIDHDMEARRQVRQWGNGALITPVVRFDGEIILDYDPVKLEQALSRRL